MTNNGNGNWTPAQGRWVEPVTRLMVCCEPPVDGHFPRVLQTKQYVGYIWVCEHNQVWEVINPDSHRFGYRTVGASWRQVKGWRKYWLLYRSRQQRNSGYQEET